MLDSSQEETVSPEDDAVRLAMHQQALHAPLSGPPPAPDTTTQMDTQGAAGCELRAGGHVLRT